MGTSLSLTGVGALSKKLIQMSKLTFDNAVNDSLKAIYDRAGTSVYTPTDSGKLKDSSVMTEANSSANCSGEVGYTADYADSVEYGHRMRNGKFLPGQYFLRDNFEYEKPIFKQRLLAELKKGGS